MEFDPLSRHVLGCAIEVHKHLGPGLLESAYQACLAYELAQLGIPFHKEEDLRIIYKDEVHIDCGYRMDFVVDGKLVVELKSVDKFAPIHEAQILTYMKLSGMPIGLLLNFNVLRLKDGGIKRFVL